MHPENNNRLSCPCLRFNPICRIKLAKSAALWPEYSNEGSRIEIRIITQKRIIAAYFIRLELSS